ncbi:hypothetical protein CHITON_0557 [Thermococcus chitonophagus]|uniref:Uncharacterized protein n=1 Tax=Thermococcus chitonophagus TaxID=54262 RepID=A0A160VSD5_9EURY|nr:hypothetical protein CHITON_0557 [Thermococcus chitonophagus]
MYGPIKLRKTALVLEFLKRLPKEYILCKPQENTGNKLR